MSWWWRPVGSRSCPSLEAGEDLVVTSWDVLGGDVKPRGDVLLFDDNGSHSALSAAELIARSGARLEIVTPERMLGVEVGGLNHVPYAKAFNETETRITLNQKVLAVRPEAGRLCASTWAASTPPTGCPATSTRWWWTTGRPHRPSSTSS